MLKLDEGQAGNRWTDKRITERMASYLGRIYRFYRDGFRSMTVGKTLWKVILIKLIIMFGVLKLFFFPDFLNTKFATDEQRADYVMEQITKPAQNRK